LEKADFRILVADDDEITRDMLSGVLQAEGYPVVSAIDGLDAIRLLRVESIQLVLTDYTMPGANGIEVLRNALRHNPDIAVVLLTAYGSLETILETIKEGAYDYLIKPFNIQEVKFVVEKAFRRAMLIDENKELIRHVRDTYRDMELIKNVAATKNPELTTSWIERVERLRQLGVLTQAEVAILKDRLVAGGEQGLL